MQEISNFTAKYSIERKADKLGVVHGTFHNMGKFFYSNEIGVGKPESLSGGYYQNA
jgi:hypothetical protein